MSNQRNRYIKNRIRELDKIWDSLQSTIEGLQESGEQSDNLSALLDANDSVEEAINRLAELEF